MLSNKYWEERLYYFKPYEDRYDRIYNFAHYDKLPEEERPFYYSDNPEEMRQHPKSRFNDWSRTCPVPRKAFLKYEKYTPYHFAGLATKLFSGVQNYGSSSKISYRWKLEFPISFEPDDREKTVERTVWEAVNIINSKLGSESSPITNLFSADPIGWTIPVRIGYRTAEGRNGLIGEKDTLGVYHYWTNWGNPLPDYLLNTESEILLNTGKIDGLFQELGNNCGRYITIDIVNLYVYVLAHELFHAWQDYHVGLLYHSTMTDSRRTGFVEAETLAEYFAINFVYSVFDDPVLANILYTWRKEADDRGGNLKDDGYTKVVHMNVLSANNRADFFNMLSEWEDKIIKESYSEEDYQMMKKGVKVNSVP